MSKYTVKKGDTLSSIAQKHKTTVADLVRINKIKNPDLINIGQVLKLKEDYYTVKRGDTLTSIAIKYNTSVPELAKRNKIKNIDLIHIGQILALPVSVEKTYNTILATKRTDLNYKEEIKNLEKMGFQVGVI